MACHPSGVCLDVVGIAASDNGRSCANHDACGSLLAPDVVVRIRSVVQVKKEGEEGDVEEERALAVYHVTGGVDSCRVGFLRRHLLKHQDEYDGRLAQIVDVFSAKSESPSDRAKHHRNMGCCRAVLIEAEYRDLPPKKKRAVTKETEVPNST